MTSAPRFASRIIALKRACENKKKAINKSAFVAIPNDKSKSRHGMTRDEKRIHRRFTFTYTHRAPTVVEINITVSTHRHRRTEPEQIFGGNFKWLSCFRRMLMNGFLRSQLKLLFETRCCGVEVFRYIQHQQKTVTIRNENVKSSFLLFVAVERSCECMSSEMVFMVMH